MDALPSTNWARMVTGLRQDLGLSQRVLAERLSVDQTTISRWERGKDLPGVRHRRQMRDMMRQTTTSRLDALTKLRVQMSSWPATLLRQGAVFVEISRAAAEEVSADGLGPGTSLYGRFGDEADEQMHAWERSGIFSGDLAMTVSLNRIQSPGGPVYFRGMDTPHISASGEIWCLCELRRLSEAEYLTELRQMGGPLLSIPYDALG
nr:helix-turn-helix transcriptional regulator [uncultured Hyphomonas sp.]